MIKKGLFYKNTHNFFGYAFKIEITSVMKVALILIVCNCTLANKIIYVDDDAFGANDGSSWENAYIYLQDALADANSYEKTVLSLSNGPVEIRVAQGTYKPDQGAGQTAGDREAIFIFISGLTLTGGYAGVFETDPNERDYKKYETILSGDLAGNDIEVNDPNDLKDEPTREDNSYCVVTTYRTDSASVLDGFTITAGIGYIYRNSRNFGGGIHMDHGKLQIRNCSFINNFGNQGGGICKDSGQLTLINCFFKANAAKYSGGGIFNSNNEIKLVNCIFENNQVSYQGGGICSRYSKINLENCIFKDNLASYGGAMFLDNSFKDSSFNNSIFIGNLATNDGGAVYLYPYDYLIEITNFTFAGNSALYGKAIFSYCDLKISNSILYNGGQYEIFSYATNIEVYNSNIQNDQAAIYYHPRAKLVWGDGNIDTDPLFADPNNGDYHLKSQAGRFDLNTQSWIIDSNTSPCIDAGDPNSSIGLEPFPNGGYINMGAYGGTSEASKSYFGKPVCETIVAGDINGDCKVDELDVNIMMIHWLEDNNPVSVKVIDGVEFRVQTDKTFYKTGENVQMEFTITNLTNEDIYIECYQIPELNLLVQKDGQQIWELLHKVMANIPVVGLPAGESKNLSHSWDMKDDDGYIVGTGTYHIVGIIYNDLLTEVRIPITILATEP
ncbi:MAG: hypothetical protein JXA96_16890 [Sedimentisphaerales bacterium]|nr:hypothetical protein [Sedimentisphaerales bacterium]